MSASRRGIDLMVGGFVLLGLGALLFLALKAANLGNFSTGPTYEVQARFDNIGGLKPRAPVKSAGVVVGRVVSISFDDQTYQARVLLSLDARIQFPVDTSAKILTAGLLGEQYIGLEPGGDTRMLALRRVPPGFFRPGTDCLAWFLPDQAGSGMPSPRGNTRS